MKNACASQSGNALSNSTFQTGLEMTEHYRTGNR
jgi:hypothetical protein